MMLPEAISKISRLFPGTVLQKPSERNWYEERLVQTSQTFRFSGEHPSAADQIQRRAAQ